MLPLLFVDADAALLGCDALKSTHPFTPIISPWLTSPNRRSTASGSGGTPITTIHATPSATARVGRPRTSPASRASSHRVGATTYADGASGLRSAARFTMASHRAAASTRDGVDRPLRQPSQTSTRVYAHATIVVTS
jgi:hypothetical protein